MNSPDEKVYLKDMQFGDVDDEPLSPELIEYGLSLYTRVREAYDAADEPLGPSDEAMLVWFTFEDGLVDHVAVPAGA